MKAALTALAALVLVTAAACQGNVFSLKLGDCYNGGSESEVSDVSVVPCTEAHDYEVFSVLTYAGDTFPGDSVIQSFAETECVNAYEPYVGKSYESSEFYIRYLTPTSQTWATGDRVIDCVLYSQSGKLTGSMRGSNR